jgi:hypothetical protein
VLACLLLLLGCCCCKHSHIAAESCLGLSLLMPRQQQLRAALKAAALQLLVGWHLQRTPAVPCGVLVPACHSGCCSLAHQSPAAAVQLQAPRALQARSHSKLPQARSAADGYCCCADW